MRKIVLIIIQLIVIILILRTSYAQQFFSGVTETVTGWFQTVVDVPERSKIVKLRDRFMRNNMSLKPHQTDYVIEVTDTADKVNKFYKLYCIKKDKNPYIFGANLLKLCAEIEQSELLFNTTD